MKRPATKLDQMRAAREAPDNKYTAEQMRRDELESAVLGSGRGAELLALWSSHYIDRFTPLDISDGALRGLEHTRNFLRERKAAIARFREKGRREES